MRVHFLDRESAASERKSVLRLLAAARPEEQISIATSDMPTDADLGVFLSTYDQAHQWVQNSRPHLVFNQLATTETLILQSRGFFFKDFPHLGVFGEDLEAPTRSLRRVAFITEDEHDVLPSTVATAVRQRFDLGLFALSSAAAQALESVCGRQVRVVSAETQDEALAPFDMVVSYSRSQVLRAMAMLKPAAWLKRTGRDKAPELPPLAYSILGIELPALLAFRQADQMLPDLLNWKRLTEVDAVTRIAHALAALGL